MLDEINKELEKYMLKDNSKAISIICGIMVEAERAKINIPLDQAVKMAADQIVQEYEDIFNQFKGLNTTRNETNIKSWMK